MTPTPKRADAPLEVVPRASRAAEPPAIEPGWDVGDGDEVSLAEYVDVVVRGRWLIGAALLVAVLAGGAYALLATPIYRTDVLVQVEDKKAGLGGLSDLSALMGDSSPAETEIEILRSRSLVGAVVDELKLDLVVRPRRFPLIGGAIARAYHGAEPRGALLGFGAFAWGGERLEVTRLSVPPSLENEPLVLEALQGGRYALLGPDGQKLVEDDVGASASQGGVELHVAALVARPGTQFRVRHVPREQVITDLQDDLRIAEKGKKTGIIQLALDGPDRVQIAATLDALSRAYLRQNVDRKSAEAEKTLEFLETQLPVVRTNLDLAERELQRYQSSKGSVDVGLEAQAAVARFAELEKAASELKLEYATLRQRFTDSHPAIVGLKDKLRRLDQERDGMEARLKQLPASELESAKRLRDAKVANELYLTLLNKAQELKVVKEGTIGNVRILDAAILPAKPVSPKRGAVLALSVLVGLGLGVALAFVRKALDRGIEDPDQVERATGVGVHAAIPHSEEQAEVARRAARDHSAVPILADTNPKDLAVESLRSLRTSLQFALLDAPSAVITVSGPAPSVGKSFVTVNLAHVLGESGKRVVVVDADLRRGHLHRYFGTDRARGLTDVIGGHVPLEDAIRATSSPNVRFLPTGTMPPNPAELLSSERFQRVLAELSKTYDLVLIDTPPILAVADAAIVGRHAGVNLFVVKSGKHPARELVAAVRQLGRNGVRIHGIVMNDVRLDHGLGRRNAYHYQYKYE